MTNYSKLVGFTTFAFAVHTVEEVLTGLAVVDPLTLTVANMPTIEPMLVFLAVQVVLFSFLAWLVLKQPTNRWPYWILVLVMAFELDHVIRALAIRSYYPGVLTSVLIVLLIVPMWRAFIQPKKS